MGQDRIDNPSKYAPPVPVVALEPEPAAAAPAVAAPGAEEQRVAAQHQLSVAWLVDPAMVRVFSVDFRDLQ